MLDQRGEKTAMLAVARLELHGCADGSEGWVEVGRDLFHDGHSVQPLTNGNFCVLSTGEILRPVAPPGPR